jgi:hypothetical protein
MQYMASATNLEVVVVCGHLALTESLYQTSLQASVTEILVRHHRVK